MMNSLTQLVEELETQVIAVQLIEEKPSDNPSDDIDRIVTVLKYTTQALLNYFKNQVQ